MKASSDPASRVEEARDWWSTDIIDIEPGRIVVRGYPIEQLIGELRFPEMIWLMLRGDIPSPAEARLLEDALVAAVDHGPHAPSIAISRMAVTCGLPVNGAMASAINALGDIHGGAGQQCMELLQAIAEDAREIDAEAKVEQALERWSDQHGKVIPGFGHRWHDVDPRAVRLLERIREAEAQGTIGGTYAGIARRIEAVLQRRKGRPIPMNIDGVTAAIYCELDFPAPLGRGLFILSRSVGILAHAWEQSQQGGRIKGPMPPSIPHRYTGPGRRDLAPRPPRA